MQMFKFELLFHYRVGVLSGPAERIEVEFEVGFKISSDEKLLPVHHVCYNYTKDAKPNQFGIIIPQSKIQVKTTSLY